MCRGTTASVKFYVDDTCLAGSQYVSLLDLQLLFLLVPSDGKWCDMVGVNRLHNTIHEFPSSDPLRRCGSWFQVALANGLRHNFWKMHRIRL